MQRLLLQGLAVLVAATALGPGLAVASRPAAARNERPTVVVEVHRGGFAWGAAAAGAAGALGLVLLVGGATLLRRCSLHDDSERRAM